MQIVFTDGLGNQMFQYALLLAMRAKGRNPAINTGIISRNIVHNGFELFDDFEIDRKDLNIIDGGRLGGGVTIFFTRKMKCFCFKEKTGYYNPSVFNTKKNIVAGYWQDIRYFENIAEDVKQSFRFRNIDDVNKSIAEELRGCESVSIHIRRGDYLSFPDLMICTSNYYDQAIKIFKEKFLNPVFYVFSDDIKWSDSFMRERGINYKLIDVNRGNDSYKDMFLMTQCRHNVIANSSFSWWGAWLGTYKNKKVVCPKIWRKGSALHPQIDEWIKIEV